MVFSLSTPYFKMTDTITTLGLGVSLTLIGLLRKGPEELRSPLLRLLRINNEGELRKVVRKLIILLSISGVIAGNRILNHFARNNWLLARRKDWNWPDEVAVVTGGSGGIGSCIVERLAKKRVKVAVIDIAELPEELKKCESAFLLPGS